jgi:hypothetical protein
LEYVRLYVTLRDDPKVIGLSDRAFRTYVNALCWTGQHETDGVLPNGMVAPKIAAELQAAGLLDGNAVHNWTNRQRTHDELEAVRLERREAGRRGGLARARAVAKQNPSKVRSKNVAELEVEKELTTNQELEPSSLSLRDDFEAFYSAFPAARKGARRPVRKAWDQALHRGAEPLVLIAAAVRYREDPNRDDAYTVGAAPWLNRDGWEEPPLPARGKRRVGQSAELLRLAMED